MNFSKGTQTLAKMRQQPMLAVMIDAKHQPQPGGSLELEGPREHRSAWILMYTAINLSNGEHATIESAFAEAVKMYQELAR